MKSSPSKWRWTWRALSALALTTVLGWMIESPIRPGLTRYDNDQGVYRSGGYVYIHGSAAKPTLNAKATGSIGTIRYTRALHANDDDILITEVFEYRRLIVVINGATLSPVQARPWRGVAARQFHDAWALANDFDGTHMLWFGYPGEILEAILTVAFSLVAVPLLILGLLAFVHELAKLATGDSAVDPRLATLRKHICPSCRYDIRGLRDCRCPECGETWMPGQVPEGLG